MDQVMNIGGAVGPGAWEFGWNAVAAIGALVAAGAALFIHFHHQRVMRDAEVKRQATRTAAIAPQLAADVMRLNWQIATSLRRVLAASRLELSERTTALLAAWSSSELQLVVIVGEMVHAGDVEWVTDDVRLQLAQLRAQVSVANAMWRKLLQENTDPFLSREEAVGEMLKATVHQVVDTHASSILLLKALHKHLPPPLTDLVNSFEREHAQFVKIYEGVPVVPRAARVRA